MGNALVKELSELSKLDVSSAGGKGASLGEMTKAGIEVPSGFVVLSNAFNRFIDETKLSVEIDNILAKVKTNDISTVDSASSKIQTLILSKDIPKDLQKLILSYFKKLNAKFVAVRSSATSEDSASAAWAGQLDSYLNTTEKNLLENVKKCWASLFTSRAIFYRFEQNLSKDKISVAVVIQKMVNSDSSGIAFSVHPVTQNKNHIIIESGFGLGEAIVSGQITPDSYVIEKDKLKIIEKKVVTQNRGLYRAANGGNEWKDISEQSGKKQVLSDDEILKLSKIILEIENHYGFPCDIEWAKEKNKFYIVQSRPITTIGNANLTDFHNVEDWVEQGRWVQSPLSNVFFSLWHRTKVVRDVIPELKFNTVFYIDHYAFQYAKDRQNIYLYLKKKYADNTLHSLAKSIDIHAKEIFFKLQQELKKDDKYLKKNIAKFIDLYTEFSGVWSIVAYTGDLPTRLAKDVGYVSTEAELFAKVHPYLRETWLEKEVKDVLVIANAIIKKYPSVKIDLISDIIKKDLKLKNLVENYLNEYSWSHINKWIGEPIDEKLVFKRIKEELINIKQGNHVDVKHVIVDEKVLDGIIQLSISTSYWRAECGKMEMQTAYRLRSILNEIAIKNNIEYTKVLLLSPSELSAVITDKNHKIINLDDVLKRQKKFFCTVDNKGNEIILINADPGFSAIEKIFLFKPVDNNHNGVLTGIGASPGFAKGVVRVVESPEEFKLFKNGEILVTDQTTPSFVPLMRMAAAIVTGKGGITSHAAIVSRELKKPCVIAIKDVNKILKNGDMIEVDANNGVVKILKKLEQTSSKAELRSANKNLVDIYIDDVIKNKVELWPPVHNSSIFIHASGWHCKNIIKKYYDAELSNQIILLQNKDKTFKLVNSMLLKRTSEEFFRLYLKNKKILAEKDKFFEKKLKIINNYYDNLTYAKIKQNSSSSLIELAKKILDVLWDTNAAVYFAAYFDKDFCNRILSEHNINSAFLDSVWDDFTKPAFPSFDAESYLDYKKTHDPEKLQYIFSTYYGAFDLDYVKKNAELKFKYFDTSVFENIALQRKKLDKIKYSLKPIEANICEYIQQIMYLRDKRKNFFGKGITILWRIAEKIFSDNNISKELIPYMLMQELFKGEKYISNANYIKELELRRQKGVSVIIPYEGEPLIEVGDIDGKIELLNIYFLKANQNSSNTIKGQIAQKGLVKGIVKIIKNAYTASHFNKGDILVTGMTRPEYVPLMKKASAIVTDEGGITCHAAIVSRELGIPCIIGTKIATLILKDGDLIEVDADNGVVRILKKLEYNKLK